MPVIRPFRALRYNEETAGKLADLVAPPYDIINEDWSETLYSRNPYNIVRLEKTREEPGDTPSGKYLRAASYIDEWMGKGILEMDGKPSIYLCSDTYSTDSGIKVRWGFIALMKLEKFGNGIHAHEKTLSSPRQDRFELVKTTRTNLSQVFSIFPDPSGDVQSLIMKKASAGKPDVDFTDDQGVGRRMWFVEEPDYALKLAGLMEKRDLIIADGHHRYETGLAYRDYMKKNRTRDEEPWDYISMYFSSADAQGMSIFPTHRAFRDIPDFDFEKFLRKLTNHFKIERLGTTSLDSVINRLKTGSERNNIFAVYTGETGYTLLSFLSPENPKEPDVVVLHSVIIENILGISPGDIEAGKYVDFIKNPIKAVSAVDMGEDTMCVLVNAVKPHELFSRVTHGLRMPQKSTYFYPKTITGLVMFRITPESL